MTDRTSAYRDVRARIDALLDDDADWVSAMATVACELSAAFDQYHWTGFYRTVRPGHLKVGPYQGGHGCLDIPFGKGVCGTSAAEKRTVMVDDVDSFPGHIACSSSTRSEIVVPVMNADGLVVAVLDVDSDHPAAFNSVDRDELEALCEMLGKRFGEEASSLIRPRA